MEPNNLRVIYSSKEQMENNVDKLRQGGWMLVSAAPLPNGSIEARFARLDPSHHHDVPEHPSLDA